jgi:hypothetical protein
VISCGFCGHRFAPGADAAACRRCALFGGCRMARCPRCGMESPRLPAFLRRFPGRRAAGRKGKEEEGAAPVRREDDGRPFMES